MSSLYYNISIEGSIGVGKTSLANMISKELNAKIILEKFEENPFLKDFYDNQDQYAFQTQLFFIVKIFATSRFKASRYFFKNINFRLYVYKR